MGSIPASGHCHTCGLHCTMNGVLSLCELATTLKDINKCLIVLRWKTGNIA